MPRRTALPTEFSLDHQTARISPALMGAWLDPEYDLAAHCTLMGTVVRDVIAQGGGFIMVMMPPRHSKTTTCAKWTPIWFLDHFPDKHVIFASYADSYAQAWGRRARNAAVEHADKLRFAVSVDSSSVKEWSTLQGGGMVSVGVGGQLTGRGADLLVIDDPIKDAVQASSDVWRERCWEWWQQTAFTRREPGATVILVMCMTGETSVLMGDGTEKPIRDVRPGEMVATFEAGALRSAKVLNWANQGADEVFEIRMKSGITVKANEMHPFLVLRDGGARWIRLKNLRVGDRILRAIGASGVESRVPSMVVEGQPSARAFAHRTTTRPYGPAGTDRPRSTQSRGEPQECGIGTGSRPRSTSVVSPPKGADARSAAGSPARTSALTGAESYASITNTGPDESGGCSATTATSPSDTQRPPRRCAGPLDTYAIEPDRVVAIVPAGREDVFDIQVEGTENFIANGLVSHNTRWHEDDLAGRLLASSEAAQWRVLRFPAIAEERDEIDREPGQALWPDRYSVEELELIRANAGSYAWEALYQQRPSPPEGSMFKRGSIVAYRDLGDRWLTGNGKVIPKNACWVGQVVDSALTEGDEADYTAVGTFACGPRGEILVLEVARAKLSVPEQWPFIVAARARWKDHPGYRWLGVEDSSAGKALIQIAARLGAPVRALQMGRGEWRTPDKVTRASQAAVVCENGLLMVPESNPPWLGPFMHELLYFPKGMHDDQVDTLSLFAMEARESAQLAPQDRRVRTSKDDEEEREAARKPFKGFEAADTFRNVGGKGYGD